MKHFRRSSRGKDASNYLVKIIILSCQHLYHKNKRDPVGFLRDDKQSKTSSHH